MAITDKRTAIENRIEAQKRKIEVIDYRIGRLMSQRVDMEDKLAKMYEEKDQPSRLQKSLETILSPEFGA